MASLAGSLLIARASLRDAFFGQSVVLLLQHNEDGAFGLVLNRPAKSHGLPFPLYAGGPCEAPGMLLLHGHADWAEADSAEVAHGVWLGDAEALRRIHEEPLDDDLRVRIFKGYSGWGPDQLESEMIQGAWAVVPANGALIFETPPQELWQRLVPPALPQFSVN